MKEVKQNPIYAIRDRANGEIVAFLYSDLWRDEGIRERFWSSEYYLVVHVINLPEQ